jgi:hypothetical protein
MREAMALKLDLKESRISVRNQSFYRKSNEKNPLFIESNIFKHVNARRYFFMGIDLIFYVTQWSAGISGSFIF